jgi:small subunit ribosomal protein S4e
MTRHQKRLSAPTAWPVGRKTNVFTVKAGAGPHGEAGVPLLILLRDVLGYVDSAKEADYALSHDLVLVNGKPISDHHRPIGMFDIVAFTEREEYYRVFPDEGGRLALTEIDEGAADSKLGKIVGKREVAGGDTQLTFHDGATLLVEDASAYQSGDSLVIDNEDQSIVVHFPFEEGALVTAVDGTHAGEIGTVASIEVTPGSGSNTVTVETEDGSFETVAEYVVVIDEKFTEGRSEPEVEETEAAEADEPEVEDEENEEDAEAEEADEAEAETEEAEAEEADADGAEEDEEQ